jgi:hypothetical protein
MWDTTARRVAQLPTSQPRGEGETPTPGRRAASVTPEPLTYSTQQRPQVPTYDGPFRNTQSPVDDAASDALPPTQALPRADQPAYRVRDYSPEARPAAAAWNAATAPTPPSELEYHTEARRLTAVPPLPPEPTPPPLSAVPTATGPVVAPAAPAPEQPAAALPAAEAAPAADDSGSVPETTLSRRELRAKLMAESTPLAPPAQLVEPAPWNQSDALAQWKHPVEPVAEPAAETKALPTPQPVEAPSDQPQAWPFAFGQPAAPATTPQVDPQPAFSTPFEPQPVEPQPVAPQPLAPQPTAPEPVAPEPVAPDTDPEPSPLDGARSLFGDIMTPISAPLTVTPEVPERRTEAPASWSVSQPEAQEPVSAPSPLPPVAPEPVANTALTNAISEFDALAFNAPARAAEPAAQAEVAPAAPVVEPPASAAVEPVASSPAPESAWSPPVGHWSRQRDLDDETQPFENTISRRIGSGSATTNALVLPTADRDIRGALTGTGEVMLTGSIDLPTTLSSTGATDRVEHESLDMLFDANDHEIVATDSAPVRAIRAVSTHNTGHGVTHTQKPKGNKSLTILLFVAGGLAIATIAVFVTALVLNVF